MTNAEEARLILAQAREILAKLDVLLAVCPPANEPDQLMDRNGPAACCMYKVSNALSALMPSLGDTVSGSLVSISNQAVRAGAHCCSERGIKEYLKTPTGSSFFTWATHLPVAGGREIFTITRKRLLTFSVGES